MKMTRIVNIACILFLALWFSRSFLLSKIEPWEIGVRQSVVGGIDEEDFGLGYHVAVPLVHSFHRLPATLQFLDYNNEPGADAPRLEVRTKENNIIFVDVSIPWRIKRGTAWQIIKRGENLDYRNKVRSTATGVLREGLAVMSSSDVQDSAKRVETAQSILPKLNQALLRYNVEAVSVLIRAIQFRPEYEQKLQNKQYFVVQGRLDEAKRQQSVAIQETDTIEKTIQQDINLKREEWNAKIEALKTEYEIEVAKLEAAAVKYDRQRRASADALFARAKAEGDLAEAKAEALAEAQAKRKTLAEDQELWPRSRQVVEGLEAARDCETK